ncbi:MAG: hypothetical protein ACJAQ2_001960, partial [Vicingaceae bacterium]
RRGYKKRQPLDSAYLSPLKNVELLFVTQSGVEGDK